MKRSASTPAYDQLVEPLVFSARAKDLIVEGSQIADRPTVLLPALYCAEVANAIIRSGQAVSCYDLNPDLSPDISSIRDRCTPDVGTIISLHPFGLYRPLRGKLDPSGMTLIVDGCHSLRTSLLHGQLVGSGDMTVFSPRKEFGWPAGGIATGAVASKLPAAQLPDAKVSAAWFRHPIERDTDAARLRTLAARDLLGERLPLPHGDANREVLTYLPIKSERRDETINKLRAAGVDAWCWQEEVPGAAACPTALRLYEELVLVPLPYESEMLPLLRLVEREPLINWRWQAGQSLH